MFTQKELLEYTQFVKQIISTVDQYSLKAEQQELTQKLTSPDIWSDSKQATLLNQNLTKINKSIAEIELLQNELENLLVAFEFDDVEAFELIKKLLDKQLDLFQNQKFLSGKFDSQGVFLSIYAGAGGVDAQDWSSSLCAMYQTFGKNQGWSVALVAISVGEEAGIKSAMLEIKGENAYGLLKEEAGVHRMVRISPFNSGGTRETSFAMVEVIPNNLQKEIDITIDEKDLRIDTFMSSGKGGQSVNTTYSAVRIVHIPTGISAQCQDERSQIMNRDRCMQILTNRLIVIELGKQKEFERELKGAIVSAQWGSQIRSYVLHPYKMVKDHRSGWETGDIAKVIEYGDILPIIWSVKKSKAEI